MGWLNQPKSWSDSDGKISMAVESKQISGESLIMAMSQTTDTSTIKSGKAISQPQLWCKGIISLFMTRQG